MEDASPGMAVNGNGAVEEVAISVAAHSSPVAVRTTGRFDVSTTEDPADESVLETDDNDESLWETVDDDDNDIPFMETEDDDEPVAIMSRPSTATDGICGLFAITITEDPTTYGGFKWMSAETLTESTQLLILFEQGERSFRMEESTQALHLVRVLARFLSNTKCLEELTLSNYWLSSEHMLILEHALLSCSSLSQVMLEDCIVTRDATDVMVRCLRKHTSLQDIHFLKRTCRNVDRASFKPGELYAKIFTDLAEAPPGTGIGELRFRRVPLRSLHVSIFTADDIVRLFRAMVGSSFRLQCLVLNNYEGLIPFCQRNRMQRRNLHIFIPYLVYLQQLFIVGNPIVLFGNSDLLQSLKFNGSLHYIIVENGSSEFWTSSQRRFVSAFCRRNQCLPALLAKDYCRVGISAVMDDENDTLLPTLLTAAQPMHRMAPTFILMGLLSMQEWNGHNLESRDRAEPCEPLEPDEHIDLLNPLDLAESFNSPEHFELVHPLESAELL